MTYFGLKNAEIAGNDTITGFEAYPSAAGFARRHFFRGLRRVRWERDWRFLLRRRVKRTPYPDEIRSGRLDLARVA